MNPHRENSLFQKNFTLNIKGEIRSWEQAVVMGILNLTPDSFHDGGRFNSDATYLKQIEKMISEGADIIDIGAFSSRPGAELIDENSEEARLIKPLEKIRKHFPSILISIDTYRSSIAKKALSEGADIINDISGGTLDPELPHFMAEVRAPYIIMHMQGKPENMQAKPTYLDVSKEIYFWLSEQINSFRKLGIADLIIDPGFGFGKSLEHNYHLLRELQHFKNLECPILVGISRKGMIQKVINQNSDNALNGSTAAHVIALLNGANILRVHDVLPAKEAISIVDFYQKQ